MPRSPEPKLLTYLAAYDPHVATLFLGLREIVLEEAPEAIESIAKGYALAIGFSFTGKPMKDGFCHIVAYPNYVNLGFNRGAELPDPHRVLTGTGKLIRHIPFRTHDDLDRPYLRRYLQAAIEQVGGRPTAPIRPAKPAAKRAKKPGPKIKSPASQSHRHE